MDIGAFIESLAELQGQLTLGDVPRLAAGLAPEVLPADVPPITWRAQGELLAQRVGPPQTWLVLEAQASLPWSCQRCLQPVWLPLSVACRIRLVADEATAAQLDGESDHDVLVLSRSFDLVDLIEDELIMASPLVPFHDECPEPPIMSVADPEVAEAELSEAQADGKPHPFAALAGFKAKKSGDQEG
jgi:uncharacterized protein